MDKRSRRSDLMSPRSAREFEMQRSRELRKELDKERDPSQPSFQTVADVLQAQTQMDDVRRKILEQRQRESFATAQASRPRREREPWSNMGKDELRNFIFSQQDEQMQLAEQLRRVASSEAMLTLEHKLEASHEVANELSAKPSSHLSVSSSQPWSAHRGGGDEQSRVGGGGKDNVQHLTQQKRDRLMQRHGSRLEELHKQKLVLTHQKEQLDNESRDLDDAEDPNTLLRSKRLPVSVLDPTVAIAAHPAGRSSLHSDPVHEEQKDIHGSGQRHAGHAAEEVKTEPLERVLAGDVTQGFRRLREMKVQLQETRHQIDQMSQIGPGNLWKEGASEAFRRELAKEQATLQHQQNVETRAKMHSAVKGNFVTAPSQLSSQLPPVASANPRDISWAPAASPASPRDPDICAPQTYPPVPPPAPESHKSRALAAPGGMVTDGGFRKSEDNGRRWGLEEEIEHIKRDYVSKGGSDMEILRAIATLQEQARGMPGCPVGAPTTTVLPPVSRVGASPLGAGLAGSRTGQSGGIGIGGGIGPGEHSLQAELNRLDAALSAKQHEHGLLARQLAAQPADANQSPPGTLGPGETIQASSTRKIASLNATHPAPGVERRGALTAEEEELREMERNPKDTDLFRLRKKHLMEMVKIKYDLELMRQTAAKENAESEVEILKKEGVRREWLAEQDQQLLQAKYRKHMAKEKPLAALSDGNENMNEYSPDLGLVLYVDFVQGLPAKVSNIQVVYGFYQGSTAKTEVRSLPLVPTERMASTAGGSNLQAVVAVKRAFTKVFPADDLQLVLEVQDLRNAAVGPRTFPLGWSVLPLFSKKGELKSGLWCMNMLHPPARFNVSFEDLDQMMPVPKLKVYCRLISGNPSMLKVHDNFIVNPEATRMQYTLVKYMEEQEREKEREKKEFVAPKRLVSGAGSEPHGEPQTEQKQKHLSSVVKGITAFGSLSRAASGGSQADSQSAAAPPVYIQIVIDGFSGSLSGHSHCQFEPVNVYVRISVVDKNGSEKPVLFSAHPSSDLSTWLRNPELDSPQHVSGVSFGAAAQPGGRESGASPQSRNNASLAGQGGRESRASLGQGSVQQDDADVPHDADTETQMQAQEQAAEAVGPRLIKTSWCSASENHKNLDVGKRHLREGVCVSEVPAVADMALLVKVYCDSQGTDRDAHVLRQDAHPDDVLIGWTRFPILDSDHSVKDGQFILPLAAPPSTLSEDFDVILKKQEQQALLAGKSGERWSHQMGEEGAVLRQPLPSVHLDLAPVSAFVALPHLAEQEEVRQREAAARGDQTERDKDTIWALPHADVSWLDVTVPKRERVVTFASSDGFDVYIDGARFLPDNVSISCVEAFATDSSNNVYGKVTADVDPRSRAVSCPVYNARKEFRANDHRPWKGDVTLVVRVDGIEHFLADSGKQDIRFGVIGFAAINVFIDPASGEAASKEASEFALNTGAFQLMLHRRGMPELSRTAAEQLAAYQAKAGAAPAQQSGDPEAPLYSLITRHPHRTCSSLLLRIVSAPYALNGKVLSMAEASSAGTEQQTSGGTASVLEEQRLEKMGLLVRAKSYASATYANVGISDPSDLERKLFPLRAAAAAEKATPVLKYIIDLGKAAGLVEESIQQLASDDVATCLKDTSPFLKQNFPELLTQVAGMVHTTLRSVRKETVKNGGATLVSSNSCLRYMPQIGFSVAVDGIDNFPPSISYSGIYSLVSTFPPADFYMTEAQIYGDLSYFKALDYSSKACRPRLRDGFHSFNPALDKGGADWPLYLVIDVRCLVTGYAQKTALGRKQTKLPPGRPAAACLGFAIIPALARGAAEVGRYTQSGNYRLPLYSSRCKWGRDPTQAIKAHVFEEWVRRESGPPKELLERLMQRDGLGEEALVAADTDAGEDREQVRQTEASVNSKLDQVMQKAEKDGIIQRVDGVTLLCRLADGSRVDEFQVAFGLDDEGEPEKVNAKYLPQTPAYQPNAKGNQKSVLETLEDQHMGEGTGEHRNDCFKTFLRLSGLRDLQH